jgi:hypothetical protein
LSWAYYIIASLIGLVVGASELISRYRDEPRAALWSTSSMLYIFVNAGASVIALYFIEVYDWRFGLTTSPDGLSITRTLIAGFGALALFRSSLFTIRMDGQPLPIGPGIVLHIILAATDRAVDRMRAAPRAVAATIMRGIPFQRAVEALPIFCFAIMQNVSESEQKRIGSELAKLAASSISDQVKAYVLGLTLLDVVGERVLRTAVETLRQDLQKPPEPPPIGLSDLIDLGDS